MPTTHDEACSILAISTEYLSVARQEELFGRLDQEVGHKTENSSLKESLRMMAELTHQTAAYQRSVASAGHPAWLPFALLAVISLHTFVVCGNILAFFVLPFAAAWWVALPLCSLIFFITLNRKLECPLTAVENHLRRQLGRPSIRGFVGHYFVKPWRRL